jgi:hypothetical protein
METPAELFLALVAGCYTQPCVIAPDSNNSRLLKRRAGRYQRQKAHAGAIREQLGLTDHEEAWERLKGTHVYEDDKRQNQLERENKRLRAKLAATAKSLKRPKP